MWIRCISPFGLRWKRRFFCVCDGDLYYYYTAEMSNPFQPLCMLPLTGVPTREATGSRRVDVMVEPDPVNSGEASARTSNVIA